jgi:predicted O-methyltransferase YrrM
VKSVHDRWQIRLKYGLSYDTLGSTLSTIYHLRLLVQLMGCKRVLEVGTFVGVTTMFLAEVLPDDGRITTVEIGAEFADIARENFKVNGLSDRIELINDDINSVVSWLPAWGRRYDLIFLDGSKQDYGRLLPQLLELLAPGGLLFVDNVFLHGDALNAEPATEKGVGVQDLLSQARDLPFPMVILPCGDGHLLLMKPR